MFMQIFLCCPHLDSNYEHEYGKLLPLNSQIITLQTIYVSRKKKSERIGPISMYVFKGFMFKHLVSNHLIQGSQ